MSSLNLTPRGLLIPSGGSLSASDAQAIASILAALHENVQDLRQKVATLIQKAAFLEMPPDGVPFNEAAYVDLLPVAAGAAVVLQFTVPQGYNGSIKWIGNNFVGAGWTEGTGALVWQILADGQPIRNFENIVGSLGSPASPSETAVVRIYETQTIQLVCTNVSIGAPAGQLLGGRLSGWYYPIEYDSQLSTSEAQDEEQPAT